MTAIRIPSTSQMIGRRTGLSILILSSIFAVINTTNDSYSETQEQDPLTNTQSNSSSIAAGANAGANQAHYTMQGAGSPVGGFLSGLGGSMMDSVLPNLLSSGTKLAPAGGDTYGATQLTASGYNPFSQMVFPS